MTRQARPAHVFPGGCLPRVSKPGEWFPTLKEAGIEVIPRSEWRGLIASGIGLRRHVPKIFDQDGMGSCATESSTQAVQVVREFQGQPFVRLNPWFVYYHTKVGGGGSNIDTNLRFMQEKGVAPYAVWPRSKRLSRPSSEAYEAAKNFRIDEVYDITNRDEFASALLYGFPVVYGRRGHSILAVEMLDDDKFIYANSWGNWGDNGFGKDGLQRDVYRSYGIWALRTVVECERCDPDWITDRGAPEDNRPGAAE